MNDHAAEYDDLVRAAKQITQMEAELGGGFLPAGANPLPQFEMRPDAAGGDGLYGQQMTHNEKVVALEQIDANEVRDCVKCQLCRSRTQTVFGDGDPDADLMFVGEGPGADEDAQGLPFVGRAGQLLNKMIQAMGLRRDQVYIANVVKCRPPSNRAPMPDEAEACWSYLDRQIRIIQPRVIVVMGNTAARLLLKARIGITRLRGQWQELDGIPVMPTFHPAYVLRLYTPDTRRRVWSDLQDVMKKLSGR